MCNVETIFYIQPTDRWRRKKAFVASFIWLSAVFGRCTGFCAAKASYRFLCLCGSQNPLIWKMIFRHGNCNCGLSLAWLGHQVPNLTTRVQIPETAPTNRSFALVRHSFVFWYCTSCATLLLDLAINRYQMFGNF